MRATNERSLGRALLARGAALLALLLAFAAVFALDVPDLATGPEVPSAQAQYGTSRRVARRTSRRTATRQNAMQNPGYPTSVPPGCALGVGGQYMCGGGQQYQPQMAGTQVVYVPVAAQP